MPPSNLKTSLQNRDFMAYEINGNIAEILPAAILTDDTVVTINPQLGGPTPPFYTLSSMNNEEYHNLLSTGPNKSFRLSIIDAQAFVFDIPITQLRASFDTGQQIYNFVIEKPAEGTKNNATALAVIETNIPHRSIQNRKKRYAALIQNKPFFYSLPARTITGVANYITNVQLQPAHHNQLSLNNFNATLNQIIKIRNLRKDMAKLYTLSQANNNLEEFIKILDNGIFNNLIIYPQLKFSQILIALSQLFNNTHLRFPPWWKALEDVFIKSLCINNKKLFNLNINFQFIEADPIELPSSPDILRLILNSHFSNFASSYRFLSPQDGINTVIALMALIKQASFVNAAPFLISELKKNENFPTRFQAQVGIDELLSVFNIRNTTMAFSSVNPHHIFNHTLIRERYIGISYENIKRIIQSFQRPSILNEGLYTWLRYKSHNASNTSHPSGIATRLQQQDDLSNSLENTNQTNLGTKSSKHENWQIEGSKLQQDIMIDPNNTISSFRRLVTKKNIILTGETLLGLCLLILIFGAWWQSKKITSTPAQQQSKTSKPVNRKVSIDCPPEEKVEMNPIKGVEKGNIK